VDPGVGIYIDDVYMGRSVGGAMDFRDIAGVQILRGPQGTLFGRNTIGGAVLLTTNGPGEDAGNTVRIGLGEDNLREFFGAVDIR
jgi:iron complex outermembrane receptor protein